MIKDQCSKINQRSWTIVLILISTGSQSDNIGCQGLAKSIDGISNKFQQCRLRWDFSICFWMSAIFQKIFPHWLDAMFFLANCQFMTDWKTETLAISAFIAGLCDFTKCLFSLSKQSYSLNLLQYMFHLLTDARVGPVNDQKLGQCGTAPLIIKDIYFLYQSLSLRNLSC